MITANTSYRFGRFTLDLDRQQLLVGDRPIPLARKNFEVLHALVEAGGRIVTRDELVCAVWPDTVVEESTLRQNIYTLRTLLRELDPAIDYVETVPKAGYRIAVAVERIDQEAIRPEIRPAPSAARPVRWPWIGLVVLLTMALGGWALVMRGGRKAPNSAVAVPELIRQGWMILDQREPEHFAAARALFDDALRLDPRSGPAHAGKAVLFILEADEKHALEEAARIEEIDPSSGAPLAIRGFTQMMNHWNWQKAGPLLAGADRRVCPEVFCRQWYGLYLGLTGQLSQAERELASAIEMNPSRLSARAQFGQILYWAGQTDAALRELQTVVDARGSATHARLDLWKAQLAAGDGVAASQTVLLAGEPSWYRLRDSDDLIQLKARRDLFGKPEFFRRLLAIDEHIRDHPYHLAELAIASGDRERALTELEHALTGHSFFLPFAKRDPLFAPLHGNPRYETIMKRVGL